MMTEDLRGVNCGVQTIECHHGHRELLYAVLLFTRRYTEVHQVSSLTPSFPLEPPHRQLTISQYCSSQANQRKYEIWS